MAILKIGGTNGNSSRMQNFANFIDNCHLLELESFGLPYTWFNKRRYFSSIFEKLDRVLINDQWIHSFRDARAENLPIIGSNHRPIVLHLDKRDIWIKAKPFRCEFWFHISGFIDVVNKAWSTNFIDSNTFQLVKKIQVFRQKVKVWNKYEVRNLEANIKQIEKKIDVVQGILMINPHNVVI